MTTDVYQFPNREMRDLAFETERAKGSKGVTKSTDQINGKMVYILAVPVPVSNLTQNPASDMVSEGSPNVSGE